MQRNHFLRLMLLAATLFSAFLIITLSIIPKPTASALPTLAVLPSETASHARQVEESQAEVAILPTSPPLETAESTSASVSTPTDRPAQRDTYTSEVIDPPTTISSSELITSEVINLPTNLSAPATDVVEVIDPTAEASAPEVAPPQTEAPPEQDVATQVIPTVDIRRAERDQSFYSPAMPVRPTEAPIDESQLTETERALLQQVQEQNRVGVIVGLAVPFQDPNSASAQELQAQQATIQQARSSLIQNLAPYNAEVLSNSTNWVIPFLALEVDEAALRALIVSPNVTSIEKNIQLFTTLDSSTPIIRAPQSWAMGYRGNGQTVVILDTGVERTHPFLGGRVVTEACFSGGGIAAESLCPNGQLFQYGTNAASPSVCVQRGHEDCSHGTHVAGIAAGYASSSFSGVAPNANIIGVQVFSYNPGYSRATAWYSDLISALNYVYAQRTFYSIAAVNMSLGGGYSSTHCDAANPAMTSVFQLVRNAGIAPVVATGNEGYTDYISFPACISHAVSVGATTDSDTLASFSNNAASIQELFAPGVSISSSVIGGGYESWDGTSMSTPHVTGAFAVYRQYSPGANVSAIVNTFRQTGKPISVSGGTVPRINLQAAILGYVPTPANDLRSNASPIVTLPYNGAQTDIWDATVSVGDPAFCTTVSNTVWYRYTASATQTLTLSTAGSEYDTVLAVFNANTLASLGCNDDSGGSTSQLTVNVTQGQSYLIGIGDWSSPLTAPATLSLSVTGSIAPTPPPPMPNGIGIYYNGTWYLRDSASSGAPNWMPQYGGFGVPVVGDWNGNGTATLGIYNPSNGLWYLRNSNNPGAPDYPVFIYGGFGLPVAGDWNGDGIDSIGLYNPSDGTWYLRNYAASGGTNYTPFQYGGFGMPVVGDWDGNGTDTIGIYNPADGRWYLRNSNSSGSASYVFQYGGFGVPVVGDWNGDGIDTIGIYNPADGRWYLRNHNSGGVPDYPVFIYGGFGTPVVGTWSINGTFGIDGAMASFSGDWEAIMEENRPTVTPTATATETATETVSPTFTATETSTLTATPTKVVETPEITEMPEETVPATPLPPTVTPEPPTATPLPPTVTPEPPTATPLPPTVTPEPPTATPLPPTATPVPPTEVPAEGTEEAPAGG